MGKALAHLCNYLVSITLSSSTSDNTTQNVEWDMGLKNAVASQHCHTWTKQVCTHWLVTSQLCFQGHILLVQRQGEQHGTCYYPYHHTQCTFLPCSTINNLQNIHTFLHHKWILLQKVSTVCYWEKPQDFLSFTDDNMNDVDETQLEVTYPLSPRCIYFSDKKRATTHLLCA